MLYELVLEKKQAVSGTTANPTMDAFDLSYCKDLDAKCETDSFVKDRVGKVIKELDRAGGIDYNDHYRNAYTYYNEAISYLDHFQHNLQIKNIPEQSTPTPDFEVTFQYYNWETSKDENDSVFLEVKSLCFGGGNLEYKRVQEAAFECNISMEEQRKKGKKITSSEYVVSPLGEKANSITSEIEIINRKIEQNIKEEQYTSSTERDTILLVDLSQYLFPFPKEDCFPVYPDNIRKSIGSGRLWMVAFGKIGERIYAESEFEGSTNIGEELDEEGILNKHHYIKALIFRSGAEKGKVKYYGFHRYEDEDKNFMYYLRELCDFINDNKNAQGFQCFDKQDTKKEEK